MSESGRVRASVAGASGYGGGELIRLLHAHPEVEVVTVTAGDSAGLPLADVWPQLRGRDGRRLQAADPERLAEGTDVAFLALPAGLALEVVPALLERGVRVVDLGPDFRLRDPSAYRRWYGAEHTRPELLAEAVYSQVDHAEWGGVVPELASRDHVRKLAPMIRAVLGEAGLDKSDLDAVAYTAGPGLAGALLVGAAVAEGLAAGLGLPTIRVHHMEGHLLSPLLGETVPEFPFGALLVSGGHTMLVEVAGPGRYRLLGETLDDAAGVAERLGAKLDELPIGGPVDAVSDTLAPLFEGYAPDLTEENIQSRLRGVLLMALSNKFGEMLLTTGNKSEVAVGYATIYGDMAGGYNPIKDLYKTRVFETCRWRNTHHRGWMKGPAAEVIPERIITKPPSAELRADQKDSDSLPDYPELDAILDILIDRDGSIADCVAAGFAAETARKVEKLIYVSEYKRHQSAPGARLTKRAFWLDRRYPIVNRWRDPTG